MRRWNNSRVFRSLNRLHLIVLVGLVCLRAGFEFPIPAEEVQPGKEGPEPLAPIGQFLTISGTVDDSVLGRVNRAALALQARAVQEKRRGILVLEIRPGSSPFHQILGMARYLSNY
jgi:membrane-bound serine protease (ClpP class)